MAIYCSAMSAACMCCACINILVVVCGVDSYCAEMIVFLCIIQWKVVLNFIGKNLKKRNCRCDIQTVHLSVHRVFIYGNH